MTFKQIAEGSAKVMVPTETKVSKKLPVFYNPHMKLNRDVTIKLLKVLEPMHLCDPLAGTGVRSIRFAKELKYKSITANDCSKDAVKIIRKNMALNNVRFDVLCKDVNLMLLESYGFDYIDLDVFGSPVFVLDSAIKRLSRKGVLAVTATDTSLLAGTYLKACKRKYWARPIRNHLMHEMGLRILVRRVQLIGSAQEKALTPIHCYAHRHYYRAFFKCEFGKKKCDEIIKLHKTLYYNTETTQIESSQGSPKSQEVGPIYTGALHDTRIAQKMGLEMPEYFTNIVGFIDFHAVSKKFKVPIFRRNKALEVLRQNGIKAFPTTFTTHGIKCEIGVKELIRLLGERQ